MPHGHQAGWAPQEIALFANQHLRGGAPLPRLTPVQIEGSALTLQTSNHVEIKSASLHATVEDGPINKRKWSTSPLTVSNGKVSGPAPDRSFNAWFITVTDPRGAVVSTPVTIRK
jgi:hypothetical protein